MATSSGLKKLERKAAESTRNYSGKSINSCKSCRSLLAKPCLSLYSKRDPALLVEGPFKCGQTNNRPNRPRRTIDLELAMADFSKSVATPEGLLEKARKVSKGESLESAGIELKWLTAYGKIARRCRDNKDFGITRYPYEQGPGVGAFTGGFFEHPEWPVQKAMEKYSSLRPLYEYDSNYINSTGYCMIFSETALTLREEALAGTAEEQMFATLYDLWCIIALRYGLRVVGLRVEFYRLSAKYPMQAKLIQPVLQGKNDVPASDDLQETLDKLDTPPRGKLRGKSYTLELPKLQCVAFRPYHNKF